MGKHINDITSGQIITDAERELLKALIEGHQDKKIAKEHDIPLHRVKYRLRTLYDKMGVSNRTQAAVKANGFIRASFSIPF